MTVGDNTTYSETARACMDYVMRMFWRETLISYYYTYGKPSHRTRASPSCTFTITSYY
jgi:hypothetical protein